MQEKQLAHTIEPAQATLVVASQWEEWSHVQYPSRAVAWHATTSEACSSRRPFSRAPIARLQSQP